MIISNGNVIPFRRRTFGSLVTYILNFEWRKALHYLLSAASQLKVRMPFPCVGQKTQAPAKKQELFGGHSKFQCYRLEKSRHSKFQSGNIHTVFQEYMAVREGL